MVETSELEAYITTTFTKIADEYNRPLNIALAMPTLVNVIRGNTEQYANQVRKKKKKRKLFRVRVLTGFLGRNTTILEKQLQRLL